MIIFSKILAQFRWSSIPDLIIVYILIYYILLWSKASKAINLVKGILLIFVIYFVSYLLDLTTLNWLLSKFTPVLIVLVVIIFQPELRRILYKVGKGQLFTPISSGNYKGPIIIKHLLRAVEQLSQRKIGGLIALEASSNLDEYAASGVIINGLLKSDLLLTLFWPSCPTHDGAVIIRNDRIIAAGCMFPLTDSKVADRRLGTRHRAAIGLSEETDAIVIVVSEETGTISIAENGNLTRFLTKEALETRLFNLYSEEPKKRKFDLKNIFS